jgi:hypothetical protein
MNKRNLLVILIVVFVSVGIYSSIDEDISFQGNQRGGVGVGEKDPITDTVKKKQVDPIVVPKPIRPPFEPTFIPPGIPPPGGGIYDPDIKGGPLSYVVCSSFYDQVSRISERCANLASEHAYASNMCSVATEGCDDPDGWEGWCTLRDYWCFEAASLGSELADCNVGLQTALMLCSSMDFDEDGQSDCPDCQDYVVTPEPPSVEPFDWDNW